MINPTTPPPIPKSRRRRWLWIIPLVILTPLIAAVVWYVSVRVSNSTAVRKLEAKVRHRGEPLTSEELATRFPPIPENENAAVPLLELWEKEDPLRWKAFRADQRPLPTRQQPEVDPDLPYLGRKARRVSRAGTLSDAQRAAAKAWLQKNADHSEAVRAALQRPKCRFPIRVTDGYDALLPHYSEIRHEAQSFRVEALHASEKGDIDSAIEALSNMQRVGNTLTNEPLLIAHLIHIACQVLAVDGAEQLLSRQRLSAPQLVRLNAIFESMNMTNGWALSLVSERAVALSVLVDGHSLSAISRDAETSLADMQVGLGFLHFIGLAAADRRLMLETFEQAAALAEKNTPEALRGYAKLETEVARKARGFPPKIFSGLLLPGIFKAPVKFASAEARRRAAIAAIAVEGYRAQHDGQVPDSWESLIPRYLSRPPVDPFTGEPLKLKPLPKGFVVYSVGANQVDDGGLERPEKASNKNFDETFTVER